MSLYWPFELSCCAQPVVKILVLGICFLPVGKATCKCMFGQDVACTGITLGAILNIMSIVSSGNIKWHNTVTKNVTLGIMLK